MTRARVGATWLAALGLAALALRAAAQGEPGARALSDSADRHMQAGRYLAALPLLAQVERTTPRTTADFEGAYATALGNAAVEARIERGLPIPVTRSAVERVAMLRAAEARVAAGERKAGQPRQLRDLRVVRAGQLAFWGFVREGYREFWSAHDALALDARVAGQAGWLEARFLDPVSDGPSRADADRRAAAGERPRP